MKRPLSLLLAATLAAGTMALSIAPAAAENFGVTVGVGNWNNDRWHADDNGWQHRRHHRHHNNVGPGFSFNFGVPLPESRAYYRPRHRDCYRNDWNEVICRR